ncbi:DUF4099 domain-containing protein [Solirubrum puertoriconensis]|uniref:DUF3945 domain-containing protein n=1 Tax=Solirubrum puertoriconensis TaxID=1751427 RepID=A0A9X0HNJ8_SOLP1|nr:DUF4099 domain-containing protein [Solirubrum puertoriconensis]KUG09183.1 hypothetical protein ASU33_20440 [Solirubrum puertoriconensis]
MPDQRPALTHDEARAQFICAAEPLALDLQQLGRPADADLLLQVARELDADPRLSPARLNELHALLTAGEQVRLLRESADFQLLRQAVQVLGAPEPAPEVKEQLAPLAANPAAPARLRSSKERADELGLLDIRVKGNPVSSFASNFSAHYQATKAPNHAAAAPASAVKAQPGGVGEGAVRADPSGVKATNNSTVSPRPIINQAEPAPAPAPAREQAPKLPGLNQAFLTGTPAGFTEAELPWALLERLGLTRAQLEENGQLAALLRGEKTALLPLRAATEQAGEPCHLRARLVLRRTGDGAANLQFELPREQLVIPEQLHGTPLGPQVRRQLLETGRGPRLAFQLPDGQELRAYVGVDREMNRLVLLHENAIRLPEQVRGVPLSPRQRELLAAGLPVALQGLVHRGTGARYDATVQIDAVRRGLVIQPLGPTRPQETKSSVRPRR